ncbi:MAG: ribosomal protein S18-alanine N-acetyltransferase [Sideroxydans sp.]|nr:ribosomal protein S18-alanine N-acetyltransferase [Sideroxydans sp.]
MRDMTLSDVAAVCAIEQQVQPQPWTAGNFNDALRCAYRCVLDEIDGVIASYAVLMPVLDEAELLTIAVAPTQQHKGLGRLMLLDILHWAQTQAMRQIFLEVRVSNVPAIALYRATGFVEIGRRRGYYQHGDEREDALLMACELKGEAHG